MSAAEGWTCGQSSKVASRSCSSRYLSGTVGTAGCGEAGGVSTSSSETDMLVMKDKEDLQNDKVAVANWWLSFEGVPQSLSAMVSCTLKSRGHIVRYPRQSAPPFIKEFRGYLF